MKDEQTRTAVLELKRLGHGIKSIARALKISRNTVRKVLKQGVKIPPKIERKELLSGQEDNIRALAENCKGNLSRVHEELRESGIDVSYATLTLFCRAKNICGKAKQRTGRYHFEPGEEMQHDTSPHKAVIGGKKRTVQSASLVLCHSRMIFFQAYERFNRFTVRIFLTDAIKYMGGCAHRCMLDNSTVIVARGTGKNAVIAPEMEGFANQFSFVFTAHALGDKNRSARVERPMHYIENNFFAGRTFTDMRDLNRQAVLWCDRVNAKFKRTIRARPIDLFQAEKQCLKPLPVYVPEPCRIHHRIVDVEGYITLHTNRYSAPDDLINLKVEVRETKDHVQIMKGPRIAAAHDRAESGTGRRMTLPEHRHSGKRWKKKKEPAPPSFEEITLRKASKELGLLVDLLKTKHPRAAGRIRKLHGMYLEYPTQPLSEAVKVAVKHGLFDLSRIERMILREIAGTFFTLPCNSEEGNNE